MRGSKLYKFFTAIRLLSQPSGTTIDELRRKLGFSNDENTHRYIRENIEDSFKLVVEKETTLGGLIRYRLATGYMKLSDVKVPDISLSLEQIVSLYFLKGQARLYEGTAIAGEIEDAYKYLRSFIPDHLAKKIEKARLIFASGVKFRKDYRAQSRVIDDLTHAMLEQKRCSVTYHAYGDDLTKSYNIDPLVFFERNGGLYIFARITLYDEIRTIAVERIKSLKVGNYLFAFPKNFDPQGMLDSAFDLHFNEPVSVKIRFSEEQARYIEERQWATGQEIEPQADGSIILSLTTSGWWDVKKWVLSYGSHAELLEPEEMRNEIRGELLAAASFYT